MTVTDLPDVDQACVGTHHTDVAVGDSYNLLLLIADQLDDLEAARIAMENRNRSLTSDDEWGKGIDPADSTIVARSIAHADDLRRLEARLVTTLQKAMSEHPLGPWVESVPGVGLKTMARLLGSIGNPADRDMPSQLWAYCGLHVVNGKAPARRKGSKANWNDEARKRIWLVAQGVIKATGDGPGGRSPYRDVYDDARDKYADATHSRDCVRCGPSGKPAQAGSELSDGHKHARAVRIVMKQILLDLWKQARGIA